MTSLIGNTGFGNTGAVNRGRATGDIIPKGFRKGQLQQFTPEQMQLFQSLFAHLSPESYLSRLAGGEQGLFEEMEAPALRQFNALQGNIASRFSGMGTGARRSSGFQNTLNQASSEFAQDLASRRQQLQQQAILSLMGLGNQLLGQRPFENFLAPKPQSAPSQIPELVGKGLGMIPGLFSSIFTGNPGGAIKGALNIFGGG